MRIAIAVAVLLALLLAAGLPRVRQWPTHRADVAAASASLRRAVLTRQLGADVATDPAHDVRCVVMDWNLSGTTLATLVAFADGTTSLYLSSGGGTLGAGSHEAGRMAAQRFRAAAVDVRQHRRHALAALSQAAQDVITAIRRAS